MECKSFRTESRLQETDQDGGIGEDPDYLTKQLITYIGNKRALLPKIGAAIDSVKRRLAKPRLRIFDAFAGSGVVSRYFKRHSEFLVSNDFEDYAAVAARCHLSNASDVDKRRLESVIHHLNRRVLENDGPPGFIEELYAPRDEENITSRDRVFYTVENARRLDRYRSLIESSPHELRDFLLGPLLSEASVHANTAGVFKGFYKDRLTKIGKFGGSNADALDRIRGEIALAYPVLSRFECDVQVLQSDANKAVREVGGLDLAYFDPPYNQHPYGSNYFMLNLLVNYRRPENISPVSGIPANWRRSGYNVRSSSLSLMRDLVENVDASFLLVSFNDEGFISRDEMLEMLRRVGRVEVMASRYNAFRGSRNLRNRKIHVTEHLFLVERR